MDHSSAIVRAALPHDGDAGRRVTPVVFRPRALALVALILLALPLLVNGRAEAQREVVEDSWAQAEAAMAADPVPRPRRARAPTRAQRRAALTQELRWQAAEAHRIRPGDIRLELRAPPHMSWVWFGAEGMSDLGWRYRVAQPLCGRSCVLSLSVGRVRLGLLPERGQIAMSAPFPVARPGRVRAHYVSRGTRVARLIGLLLLSHVVGVAAAYGVFRAMDGTDDGWGQLLGSMFVGLVIIVPTHLIGFFRLGKARPTVRLDFTPAGSPAARWRGSSDGV